MTQAATPRGGREPQVPDLTRVTPEEAVEMRALRVHVKNAYKYDTVGPWSHGVEMLLDMVARLQDRIDPTTDFQDHE